MTLWSGRWIPEFWKNMLLLPSKCMKAVCSFRFAYLNRLEKKLVILRMHMAQFPKLNACKVKPVFKNRPHVTGLSLQCGFSNYNTVEQLLKQWSVLSNLSSLNRAS